jgi:prephenate dehydrogenase
MVESNKKQSTNSNQTSFLSSSRIAIFGLGLMGGSLAIALKGKCREIYGYDPNPSTLDAVVNMKLADYVSDSPDQTLHMADLVILATPVQTILQLINVLPEIHKGSAVITDIGSTKMAIFNAYEMLPERFDPIGGHPICGKEKSSIAYAEKDLYRNAPYCLTRLERTSRDAGSLLEEIILEIGAIPIWLEADLHDKLIASTSHLPYLIAINLALSTSPDSSLLVGPGFRDTGRLAGSDIDMMMDILISNRSNILETMYQYNQNFQIILDTIEREKFSELRKMLIAGAQKYNHMING